MSSLRTPGKLLGRSTALWVSLIAAALNLVSVLGLWHPTADQVLAVNTFAFILVGILANEENPTTAGTFSATTQTPEVLIEQA